MNIGKAYEYDRRARERMTRSDFEDTVWAAILMALILIGSGL